MLNDMIIVETAASAFNNTALLAPAFLWWAILALPIFWIAHICAAPILNKIGWTHDNIIERATSIVVALSLAWIIMFGGNYGVLRDGVSILPWLNATILFVGTIFITSHMELHKPISRRYKVIWAILILIGLIFSAYHTWWGILLQIGAVLFGIFIGRAARCPMRPVAGTILIILTITTAIMTQPEFFRFGKLGELTFAHMAFILLTGMTAVITLVLNNIHPRARIHHSAYIKLKWMLRFITILGAALMFLTESVPVFLGTLVVFGLLTALSVWHAGDTPYDLSTRTLAITIGLFGVITTMPVVTSIAVLIWCTIPRTDTIKQIRNLL